jgi:hypothetical protein
VCEEAKGYHIKLLSNTRSKSYTEGTENVGEARWKKINKDMGKEWTAQEAEEKVIKSYTTV